MPLLPSLGFPGYGDSPKKSQTPRMELLLVHRCTTVCGLGGLELASGVDVAWSSSTAVPKFGIRCMLCLTGSRNGAVASYLEMTYNSRFHNNGGMPGSVVS